MKAKQSKRTSRSTTKRTGSSTHMLHSPSQRQARGGTSNAERRSRTSRRPEHDADFELPI